MPRIRFSEIGNLTGLDVAGDRGLSAAFDRYNIVYSTDRRTVASFPGDFPDLVTSAGERIAIVRLPGLLRVTTRFILDDHDGKLEISRRIRNISRSDLWIHRVEAQTDPRFSRYWGEAVVTEGGAPAIGRSLNLNPPPERSGPPDHQPDHCLEGEICPPPSGTAAPSLRIEPTRTEEGARLVYQWAWPARGREAQRLRPGRELLLRLTYFCG
jgi:hypothetical protein